MTSYEVTATQPELQMREVGTGGHRCKSNAVTLPGHDDLTVYNIYFGCRRLFWGHFYRFVIRDHAQ
jgi:hypothetical protein